MFPLNPNHQAVVSARVDDPPAFGCLVVSGIVVVARVPRRSGSILRPLTHALSLRLGVVVVRIMAIRCVSFLPNNRCGVRPELAAVVPSNRVSSANRHVVLATGAGAVGAEQPCPSNAESVSRSVVM